MSPVPSIRSKSLLFVFLGLLALSLAGVGAWLFASVKRAAAVWPEGVAPLERPEPALPVDPQARAVLDELFAAVPEGLDSSELRQALETEGAPSEDLELPEGTEQAFAVMDRFLERSGVAMESFRLDQDVPPFLTVTGLARARLLRAWRYAGADRADEALAEMLRVARLGLMFEHGGGNLLSAMVGIALSQEALDELVELLRSEAAPSDGAVAALAAELEATAALPTGLEGSFLGECSGAEALYDDMRHWSRRELFATTDPTRGWSEPEGERNTSGDCCFPFYDADRTIQLARHHCRMVAASALEPGSERVVPVLEPLAPRGVVPLGAWLDNPVGRILLDIATPAYGGFIAREDALRSRRALLVAWVALERWRRAHPDELPPTELAALVPDYLSAVPVDPWDGEAVRWDPLTGSLWVSQGEGDAGDERLRMKTSWPE
jgi:hypothetical protein